MKHTFKDQERPVLEEVKEPEVVEEAPAPKEPIFATVVNTERVNVRSTPEIGDNRVNVLFKGEKVRVISKGDAWTQTTGGYIMTQYLQF